MQGCSDTRNLSRVLAIDGTWVYTRKSDEIVGKTAKTLTYILVTSLRGYCTCNTWYLRCIHMV